MKTLFAIILIIILLEATILLGMVVYDELEVRRIIKHKADRKTEPQRNMAEDIVESFGFNAESYRQAKAKKEPQMERSE